MTAPAFWFLIGAAILSFIVWNGVRTGKIYGRAIDVSRKTNPINFRIHVLGYSALALACLVGALANLR